MLDRETVKARLVAAFDSEQDDPLGAVLKELAMLNEEAGLAGVADLMDAPEVGPSEQYEKESIPEPYDTPIEERSWHGWDMNPYSNPEACGLELIATAEEEPFYDFHIVALWQDKGSNRYFMAYDSGCSCPSPFEDHCSVSDLTEVTHRMEATQFLNSHETGAGWADQGMSLRNAIRDRLPEW